MKTETIIKHIQSSIKKWEGFLEDASSARSLVYDNKYWHPCGYCKITNNEDDCDGCILYKVGNKEYSIPYCHMDFLDESSIAGNAILLADDGDFPEALNLATILIKKMKRDLRKYQKELENESTPKP